MVQEHAICHALDRPDRGLAWSNARTIFATVWPGRLLLSLEHIDAGGTKHDTFQEFADGISAESMCL